MKTLELNFAEQNELNTVLIMLDSYVSETGKRVAYKWGAERRVLAQNVSLLHQALQTTGKVREQVFAEHWPDLTEIPEKDVEGTKRFRQEEKKLFDRKEKFEFEELSSAVLYGDQEFPLPALAALEKFGLVK